MKARTTLRLVKHLLPTAAAIVFLYAPLHAQVQAGTAQQPQDAATSNSAQTSTPLTATSSSDLRRDTLSATQIDDIVQQRPELMVELKSLLADQLQQQGINTLADSITDEQFLQQVALSSTVRANITQFLRARGYITQADLQQSSTTSRDDDDQPIRRDRDTDPDLDQLTPNLADLPSTRSQLDPTTRQAPSNDISIPETPQRLPLPKSQPQARTSARNEQQKPEHNITDTPESIHRPAPYNLQSLRDLYAQVPQDSTKLKRFGSDVFVRRDTTSLVPDAMNRQASIDVPIGPDYILGAGDGIVINLSGGVSQTLNRTIDREGKIALPEAGSVVVAGLSLDRAQQVIEDTLKQQFRSARADVTIARLRTVRIYVVGDVQRPGAYDVTSLSTPLNALYAAGGPTGVGSLRIIRHYRGQQLIRDLDLYDFLLHGVRNGDDRLASGDTLLVPPAGREAAVYGAVRRPAIYELKGNETLAALLEDAGGATVAASLSHITIDRIKPNQQRETITFDKDISTFAVQDGDRIHVSPIVPYSERAIYLEGHVLRPGKLPYRDGLQLGDVLRSYQDLLPEPSSKAEIIRLIAPDLHAETIDFDLPDLLAGNIKLPLQPFDTIRVYGRYEIDAPQVTIRGEVLKPGTYSLSQGMTAAELVRMAGGFRRDALLDIADLTSYSVVDGSKVVSERSAIQIGAATRNRDAHADVALKPGDILTIHQISGWSDIGSSVKITGEVAYPGSYGLQEGERLSSVLRRAGNLRATAYPDGAILIRLQVKQLEDKSRNELIRQIETTSASARVGSNLSGQDESTILQAANQQQAEVLQKLRNQPASGRLVIHISADINSWANTPADIELRSGDVLTIPKRPGFVLVSGQVYNASAITFAPGKSANWYLQQAGGTNEVANNHEIFIIRADGSVIGKRSSGGLFSNGVLSTKLGAGDVIVVPQRIIGGSLLWKNLLTVAQITSSLAITAAVAGVL